MTLDISFTGSYIYVHMYIYMYRGVNPGLNQEEGNGKPPPCALPGKRLWLTSRSSPGFDYDLMELSIYIYTSIFMYLCKLFVNSGCLMCTLTFWIKIKIVLSSHLKPNNWFKYKPHSHWACFHLIFGFISNFADYLNLHQISNLHRIQICWQVNK